MACKHVKNGTRTHARSMRRSVYFTERSVYFTRRSVYFTRKSVYFTRRSVLFTRRSVRFTRRSIHFTWRSVHFAKGRCKFQLMRIHVAAGKWQTSSREQRICSSALWTRSSPLQTSKISPLRLIALVAAVQSEAPALKSTNAFSVSYPRRGSDRQGGKGKGSAKVPLPGRRSAYAYDIRIRRGSLHPRK